MSLEELLKILLSENCNEMFLCHEDEIFEMIPELKLCKGFNQNNDWHIYDVYEHTLCVMSNVSRSVVLRLAALFHDTGKPFTYTEDNNGVGHFYGHYKKSLEIFKKFSEKYNLDSSISNLVSKLIYYHDINISKLDKKGLEEFFKVFSMIEIDLLYELKEADLRA